jgi:hypothetical protein
MPSPQRTWSIGGMATRDHGAPSCISPGLIFTFSDAMG